MDNFLNRGNQIFKEKFDEIDNFAKGLPTDEEIVRKTREKNSGAEEEISKFCNEYQATIQNCKKELEGFKISGKKNIIDEINAEKAEEKNEIANLRSNVNAIQAYEKSSFFQKIKTIMESKEGIGFKKKHYRAAMKNLQSCELYLKKRIKEKEELIKKIKEQMEIDIMQEQSIRVANLENETERKIKEAIKTIQCMKEI